MNADVHETRTYLCVADVLSIGQYAALEVEAPDALAAERLAQRRLGERYECVEIVDLVRTDNFVRSR
ncbi:MAG TPA: hypothetical protein VIL48_19475 [Acidimicrobiales bacterium]